MKSKKYIDYRLLGLIGSVFMILSEFLPWFSGFSLFQIFIVYNMFMISTAFLYLFPLVCGIICIFATAINLYKEEYRINSVIIYFVGLGFMLFFFYEIIPNELGYLTQAMVGFYFCLAGFLLILIDIINILMVRN